MSIVILLVINVVFFSFGVLIGWQCHKQQLLIEAEDKRAQLAEKKDKVKDWCKHDPYNFYQ